MSTTAATDIWTRPAELLRDLIRFDTTNPPGNERACISYIEGLLTDAGIESTIRAREPERPNLSRGCRVAAQRRRCCSRAMSTSSRRRARTGATRPSPPTCTTASSGDAARST